MKQVFIFIYSNPANFYRTPTFFFLFLAYSSELIFYFLSFIQEIGIFAIIFHWLKGDYLDKSLLSYGLWGLSVAWLLKDLRRASKPYNQARWFSKEGGSKGG